MRTMRKHKEQRCCGVEMVATPSSPILLKKNKRRKKKERGVP